MAADVRACPWCAEEIKAAAIVCKHCGRDVVPAGVAAEHAPGRPMLTAVDAELVSKHGIVWQDERWLFQGNHFRQVGDAIAMAESWSGKKPVQHVAKDGGGFRWWMLVVMLVGGFLAWALLRTPSPEEEARHQDRYAIQACWEEQGRKSLAPGQARFVASVCEELEKRFRERHGVAP